MRKGVLPAAEARGWHRRWSAATAAKTVPQRQSMGHSSGGGEEGRLSVVAVDERKGEMTNVSPTVGPGERQERAQIWA